MNNSRAIHEWGAPTSRRSASATSISTPLRSCRLPLVPASVPSAQAAHPRKIASAPLECLLLLRPCTSPPITLDGRAPSRWLSATRQPTTHASRGRLARDVPLEFHFVSAITNPSANLPSLPDAFASKATTHSNQNDQDHEDDCCQNRHVENESNHQPYCDQSGRDGILDFHGPVNTSATSDQGVTVPVA
jgi:hypothetical protein